MQLPALEPHERAYLQALQPNGSMQAFASRLRQRLVAALGVQASVSVSAGGAMPGMPTDDEPLITIEPELAAAWLALRLGGKVGMAGLPLKDITLAEPFKTLVRRALAESVINTGPATWPQVMRLHVAIGGQQGAVEVCWNSECAMTWAHRAIREKA